MLKILLSPKRAERHPFEIFLVGFIYSSLSILFAAWVFPEYASIAMIFLTVFSCLYLIQSAIRIEEEKEAPYKSEKWILKEHSRLITLLLFLFLGFVTAFAIWSFFLPLDKVTSLFSFQESTVDGIRATISTGNFASSKAFFAIFVNNLKVMLISLIFALFYGAGAIYILVWNASVMGLVIGNLAKETLGAVALPIAFTKYLIHGIPEMLAYLTIALSGGLIYIALWKGDFKEFGKSKKILTDMLILVGIAILLLICAGLIEVYLSPHI